MIGKAGVALGRDAIGRPDGMVEQGNFSAVDGLERGEAVLNLGDEGGGVGFGVSEPDRSESNGHALARWNAGDSRAGGVGVGRDGDVVDEAEVDDVERAPWVVAVAQRGEDVGFGEGRGLGRQRHGWLFVDNFTRFDLLAVAAWPKPLPPQLTSGIGNGMVHPPGYRFVHNLPNKSLASYRFCRILKTKEIICKIFKTLELWFLGALGRHKPEAGGFCLVLG